MRVEEERMKESGMDKPIELLNEYEKEKMGEIGMRWTYYDRGFHRGEEGYYYSELQIISKSFGFIKWLVDNDKIDLLQLDNRIALSEFNKVERVLMSLSISDTPIEDLISYLKIS